MVHHIVYSIGHSTRPIDEFVALLKANGVEELVDIRTVPGSRRNPQFNEDELQPAMEGAGLKYRRMKDLGGLRKAQKDSINTGWHNDSFRGYADYMQTEQFQNALTELIVLAKKKTIAIMCAEAVPWRCHRNLVSDALTVSGFVVKHIIGDAQPKQHKLCPFAQVEESRKITYPA